MLLDIKIDEHVVLAFGTPILRLPWPGTERLNGALRDMVLAREKAHPELQSQKGQHSNEGGWRSRPDVMSWPDPEIAELGNMIRDGMGRLLRLALGPDPGDRRIRVDPSITAWVNLNRHGSYNVVHSHPGHELSGVYYVSVGEPDPAHDMSGVIEFQDPRPGAAALPLPGFEFGQMFMVRPTAGLMLIFPSWQMHMVHPFFGKGERISVAFNIKLANFAVVD